MESRMTHPVYVVPAALQALLAYSAAADDLGLTRELRELVNLRASQINGCSVCVQMHAAGLRKEGCSDERIDTVAAWRDAPYFTDAERVALQLAEELTRVADRGDPVSDELWAALTVHYDERAISGLMIAITGVNVWNRLNAATRQPAGVYSA